jgi:hypothetical protein
MGTVLFSALIIVLMNLIIDISYGFVDPRVCYQVGMPFSKRGTFAARASRAISFSGGRRRKGVDDVG